MIDVYLLFKAFMHDIIVSLKIIHIHSDVHHSYLITEDNSSCKKP